MIEHLTEITPVTAAIAVMVISVIGMIALYFPEIKAFAVRALSDLDVGLTEEQKMDILGPIFIILMLAFVFWLIFMVVRVIKYAWQLPL